MAKKINIRRKIASYLFSWFYEDAPRILEEADAIADWDPSRADAFVITAAGRKFRVVVSEIRS